MSCQLKRNQGPNLILTPVYPLYRTEQEQLQAIFELLRKQESELDMNPMDEHDLKAQLKMYR